MNDSFDISKSISKVIIANYDLQFIVLGGVENSGTLLLGKSEHTHQCFVRLFARKSYTICEITGRFLYRQGRPRINGVVFWEKQKSEEARTTKVFDFTARSIRHLS